jgi:hypothetical protein
VAKIATKMEIPEEVKEIRRKEEQLRLEREKKKQEYQNKLAVIADKKNKGKLTLDDIDTKLDIILSILQGE